MVRIGLLKIMTMFFYLYWRAVSELRRSQIQSVVVVAIGMWSSRSELLLCRYPHRGGKEAGEGDLRWRACPCQIWSSVVVHAPPVLQDLSPWPAWIHGRSDTFWPRLIHGRLRLIPIMSPQSIYLVEVNHDRVVVTLMFVSLSRNSQRNTIPVADERLLVKWGHLKRK